MTTLTDTVAKSRTLMRAGVREYWIADTASRTVEVLLINGDVYRSKGSFRGKALLPSEVIPDFPLQVEQFLA